MQSLKDIGCAPDDVPPPPSVLNNPRKDSCDCDIDQYLSYNVNLKYQKLCWWCGKAKSSWIVLSIPISKIVVGCLTCSIIAVSLVGDSHVAGCGHWREAPPQTEVWWRGSSETAGMKGLVTAKNHKHQLNSKHKYNSESIVIMIMRSVISRWVISFFVKPCGQFTISVG